MSPTKMCDPIMGANGLQPRKFPTTTILHSSPGPPGPPPSHKLKSELYPFVRSQSSRYWQKNPAIAATPTPSDESLRAPRYQDLSCDHRTQKYHVQSEHSVHQSDVFKHGTSVSESQQNLSLQGSVNNASGPERRQGPYKSRPPKAHWDTGSSKPSGKDDPAGDRTRARDLAQGTVAVVMSLKAVNAQPNGYHPPGAPPMRPIPLPRRQEGDQYMYYGPRLDPGSWLTGNGAANAQVDDVQNVLSCLDVALPVPFN